MAGPVDGRFLRRSVRAMAVIWGLVALAVGVASVVGLARAVVIAVVVALGLVLLVALSVRYVDKRKFPPVRFTATDVDEVEGVIELARRRLASGDSAAFAIHPTFDESRDATGQIWLFADEEGRLGRVSVEFALPASVLEPARHPGLASLLSDGWEVQSAQPGEWVLITRSDVTSAFGLVPPVVEAVARLFDIPPGSSWTGRAFA